jgi:hypothetical protein
VLTTVPSEGEGCNQFIISLEREREREGERERRMLTGTSIKVLSISPVTSSREILVR